MTDKALIKSAMDNFASAVLAYGTQRSAAREDLSFVAGNQYTTVNPGDDDYRLTVNLLGPFLRQITAEARDRNPAIKVVPVSTTADVDTAEVIAGMIRHIEQKSNSEHVYQQALWYAAASGEGYIRVNSEYCDPTGETDEQELTIELIDNPEKVFLDPNHNKLDGSDAEWGFIIEDLSKDVFMRKFPDSDTAGLYEGNTWSQYSMPNDWINEKTVRVARYWVKDYETVRSWKVQDPVTLERYTVNEKPGDDVILLQKRPTELFKTTVREYQLTCHEILGETTFPGPYLPIVKVTGESFWVGGQKNQFGAIRMAKDPQRQYNFAVSRQTEMIDQAPKNSFVITEKQMGNHAQKWADANRVNYGALPYVADEGAEAPHRVSGLDQGAFQGVAATRQQAFEDMKMVFGLQDASMGIPGNEVSGIAQQGRVEQGSRSTYQYFDHLLLSLKQLGRVLIAAFPTYYDTERVVRIVKPTDEEQMVTINSMKNSKSYRMGLGRYDVTISTGPAYASKREQAFESLTTIQAALPEASQVIGDLIASQIDSPVAKIAAARIKATIPSQILQASGEMDSNDQQSDAEKLQQIRQQLAMITQQYTQLEAAFKETSEKLKTASDKAALELTKADMEKEQAEAKLEHDKTQAAVEAKKAQEQLEFDRAEAMAEYDLKREELRLKAEEIEIAKREMALKEKMAEVQIIHTQHRMNEDSKPVREDFGLGEDISEPGVGNDMDLTGSEDNDKDL